MSSHDDGAERAILGACLNATGDDDPAIDALRSCHAGLYLPRHRLIARAVLRVANEGPIDAVAVHSVACEFEPQEALWGGASYLTELLLDAAQAPALRFHAKRIIDKAYRRTLAQHAEALMEQAGNGASTEQVLAAAREMAALGLPDEEVAHETWADVLELPESPERWLAKGLFLEGEISILAGAGGLGKTWVGLHIAACLASGKPVFGRFEVGRKRNVGILDLERGQDDLRRRVRKVCSAMGLSAEDALRIQNIRARFVLDSPADAPRLIGHVKTQGIEWLLIDSLQAGIAGDDCKAQDLERLFRTSLHPLRDAGCGTQVIDHVRKARGDKQLDSIGEALHGSTRKRNAADSLIGIERHPDGLAWKPDKANNHALAEPGVLALSHDGARIAWSGALDLASDAVQDSIIALLSKGAGASLPRGDIVGKMARAGFSQRTVDRALSELCNREVVDKTKTGRQTVFFISDSSQH